MNVTRPFFSLLSNVKTLLEKNQRIIPRGETGDFSAIRTKTNGGRKTNDSAKETKDKEFSNRQSSDSDGKGLTFCSKPKSHDKIKLAQERFNYTSRLKLKEYFYENITKKEGEPDSDEYKQMPFFQ